MLSVTMGAYIIIKTIVGVPYCEYRIFHPQNPIPITKAPILARFGDLERWAFGATRRGTGVWRQKPRSTEQHHFRQSIVMCFGREQ